MWYELLTAIALVLVLEGLMPFINPRGYKNVMEQVLHMPENQLRNLGLASMVAGAVLLYFVR